MKKNIHVSFYLSLYPMFTISLKSKYVFYSKYNIAQTSLSYIHISNWNNGREN